MWLIVWAVSGRHRATGNATDLMDEAGCCDEVRPGVPIDIVLVEREPGEEYTVTHTY